MVVGGGLTFQPREASAKASGDSAIPRELTIGFDLTTSTRWTWLRYAGLVETGSPPLQTVSHGTLSGSGVSGGAVLGLHAGWFVGPATTIGVRGELELAGGTGVEYPGGDTTGTAAVLAYVAREWGATGAYRVELEAGRAVAACNCRFVYESVSEGTGNVAGWRFGAWGARTFRSSPTWAWRVGPEVVLDLLGEKKGTDTANPQEWSTTSLRFGLRGSVAWD